jgi:hypothetical protein
MELLERGAFLQTLAEYAGEAERGSGRLVLVSGESGMGKTVLLEEFQHQLPGARWLWGGCDGLLTPARSARCSTSARNLMGSSPPCAATGHRGALFTGFLAEIGPPAGFTVAVIEDVHWADEATIDLLSFLGRRLGDCLLLLASYRDDEMPPTIRSGWSWATWHPARDPADAAAAAVGGSGPQAGRAA